MKNKLLTDKCGTNDNLTEIFDFGFRKNVKQEVVTKII